MNRLYVSKLVSIGAVDAGDDPEASILFFKRKFDTEQREQAAARGAALPDGSYPILNVADLRNAVQAFGRAKNPDQVKAHIIRRARALGATNLLPDDWQVSKQEPAPERAELVKGALMGDLDLSVLDEELREQIESHITGEVEKRLAEAAVEPEEEEEVDVLKAAPDEVQELVAKLQSDLSEREAELAEERLEKQRAEWVKKAEPLEDLLGDAKEIGELLRELSVAAPEAVEKLLPALEAAGQRLEMGDLFKEKGATVDESDDDPIVKRDQFVAKFREDHPDVSEAAARAEFWRQNAAAVERSREK